MEPILLRPFRTLISTALVLTIASLAAQAQGIGKEVSIDHHLADGEEFTLPLAKLLEHGRDLFAANWTIQEGGGRPQTKGTGAALSDPSAPLVFPRAFNRVSAPDANSCMGCHNAPFGQPGGGGDFVTSVFVLGHRFDAATFDHDDPIPLKGAVDESGAFATLPTIANSRATLGMNGSGFVEMLARSMTADLRAIRDTIPATGGSAPLLCKGVSFGTLMRLPSGRWDTSKVEGLPPGSTATSGGATPPSLTVIPFHQAGAVVSLRQFSNNAFNHHHGIQTVERFGPGDPDQDGFTDEMTVADVTAVSAFQAALSVPGRVIPNDPAVEQAVRDGEQLFVQVGCASCHVPCMPLDQQDSVFSEPSPFSPAGNLQLGDPYVATHGVFSVDLTSSVLPAPRLKAKKGLVHVPLFSDLKLHDITSGPGDPNREPLNMHQPLGSVAFFAGNSRFVTKKLWGAANEPPYFHHGQYTTLRDAIQAHAGEAEASRTAWDALSSYGRDAIVEFLKTLQVLPPGTKHLVVDEKGKAKSWPEFPWTCQL